MVDLRDCFKYFAGRQGDGVVITSAGVTSGTWWRTTHDMDQVFYLGASMSMISMFGAGIAMGAPKLPVWVFMGDGAFVMNPGMLMVERDLNLPNLKHFLVSNRVYNATGAVPLANAKRNDYAGIARPWASNASLRSTLSRDCIASSTKSYWSPAIPSRFSKWSPCAKNRVACRLMMLNRNFASGATSRERQGSKSSAIRPSSV
jgi:hypothetical protein